MHLRRSAAIALAVYLAAQALPAFKLAMSSWTCDGWQATYSSCEISLRVLSTPSNLKGLVLGGSGAKDRLAVGVCLSGAAANLLMLPGILCGLRGLPTATLVVTCAAMAAAGACLMVLLPGSGFSPFIGCWLWIGSMIGLSAAAAWSLWREQLPAVHREPPG